MNSLEENLDGSSLSIAVVVAKFNEFITDKLLEGAIHGLTENGVESDAITVAKVPGSFEIPVVAKKMALTGDYNAVICLGSVIKGDTDHYEFVAREAANGIAQIALSSGVPVIFGVLTTHTMQHALDRAGGRKGNSGHTCAITAIETANMIKEIS
ncbi:MAG: 6,7-dimethyl-8-ribityllumazine synthase [Dehalococcoidia bacterium]